MSDTANSEGLLADSEKPVTTADEVKFPPFPEPTDKDFDDVPEEERIYFKNKFSDLNLVKSMRLHCTSCDRHLGSSARNVSRMRAHPMLRTLVCHSCHTFYNSGEFEKGDDGSELYCRWCGQGGQVYCCSNCPHVFCAKCIKRNFGNIKIKEIESTDDWKCFKCSPECLKDLRAVCWATLRFCDLKNEITYKTEDPKLKELYQKDSAHDYSECCKSRIRRKEKESKKKESEHQTRKQSAASLISKIPSTIQVKKFASINADDSPKKEKKTNKRPASPRNNPFFIKNPIAIAPAPRVINPISLPTPAKKLKISNMPMINAIRIVSETRPATSYTRIKQRPSLPMISNFNGFNNSRPFNDANMVPGDNINLSLESLTQGLDMATMSAMSSNEDSKNDDVVCTPDFPMEPLCQVTEDNDDDVQCITPDPVILNYGMPSNPPPLVPRSNTLPDFSSDNIIQMTENDVTVNLATGGLKFRVDPQTLSSNKMYRLPDGRVFAIKANPNMPGGYSATIVAVADNAKAASPQGATYGAKLSAVSNVNSSTPKVTKPRNQNRSISTKRNNNALPKPQNIVPTDVMNRECDLHVPVEWYRYNLIDAVDALEYSLSRLNKLKKEATTMFLRTRNMGEMRTLHRTLERLLSTSSKRFNEIRDNLNKEFKQYISRKKGENISDEDDDDVEILPDLENDDPIFIDENSVDSNVIENQEVDLTGTGNSEKSDSSRLETDQLEKGDNSTILNSSDEQVMTLGGKNIKQYRNSNKETVKNHNMAKLENKDNKKNNNIQNESTDVTNIALVCDESLDLTDSDQLTDVRKKSIEKKEPNDVTQISNEQESPNGTTQDSSVRENSKDVEKEALQNVFNEPETNDKEADEDNHGSDKNEASDHISKQNCKEENCDDMQDSEMSSELIENLLKDDKEAEIKPICDGLDITDLQET